MLKSVPAARRLFLIDTYGFIFRAYHARARSNAPPMRTSAGLSTEAVFIFNNMLRKLLTQHKPDYIAAVLESSQPTFREAAFAAYKANRSEMPPDLRDQLPYVHRLLDVLRVPTLQYPGYEADDVIGAIARSACLDGAKQKLEVVIVSSDKDLLQLVNSRVFMLNPMKDDTWYDSATVEQFLGVPPERVSDLLALKGDSIDNIPGAPGIGEKGAKDLIQRFGPVEAILEHASEVERKMYRESLLGNRDQILLSKQLATIHADIPVAYELASLRAGAPDTAGLKQLYRELEFFSLLKDLPPEDDSHRRDYVSLDAADAVNAWLAARPAAAPLAVAFDPTNGYLGLSYRPGEGRVIPFLLADAVRDVLRSNDIPKVVHDVKTLSIQLADHSLQLAGAGEDVMLWAFLLSADPAGNSLEALAERLLDRKLNAAAEQQAEAVLAVAGLLRPQLADEELARVYREIDLPLAPVLAAMEVRGIRVDTAVLEALSSRLSAQLDELGARICREAGRDFNINSPQQLGKVLFEDLRLPAPTRAGKGKVISTAADVLESLAVNYPIARMVLDYRQLAKLKGTYSDALPQLIRPATGRVHTTFNQTGAATGRLSSSNPNLQNIPIRSEVGREIRAAFIPEPGWDLLVADYSQIELRLLAHMSEDPVLLDAFSNGQDIHTRTAAEVFKVAPEMVSSEMRRNAKAVNFGIVYGQTPFGLAQQLGIDRREAELYIRRYFERYAGVREFIDRTIEEVRQSGVAKTLFGRRRPIPDMASRNPSARSFAERTAVNTPLQGTAADLIKLAMIRIHRRLTSERLRAQMLLQVHDELIFEAPPEEIECLRELVRSEMEHVHPLRVPLLVEVGTGSNWRDAK